MESSFYFFQSGMVLQSDPLSAHVYGKTDSEETITVEVICNSGHGGEYIGTNVSLTKINKKFSVFLKHECMSRMMERLVLNYLMCLRVTSVP